MAILFNRKIFFDLVRHAPFNGNLSQQQVDGMNFKLDVWEADPPSKDLRFLSYPLATCFHETASTMWPIEEFGKGAGQPYGERDPETGQRYYGRGDVQLTWRDGYSNATKRLGLTGDDDLEWHAEMALDPPISASVMYRGMVEGWFRTRAGQRETLARYFSATKNDAYNARSIINGDKARVPSWSNGVSIGRLVKDYHEDFLEALNAAKITVPTPAPAPLPSMIEVALSRPLGVTYKITIDGKEVYSG